MKINNPHKIPTLLLTFQKKKLYYNRISESQLYLPYRVFAYFFLWAQLIIEQSWVSIKRSFLNLLIVVGLIGIILNQTSQLILNSYSSQFSRFEIELEMQAILIPSLSRQSTSFYQFKSFYGKRYINSQEELYRSIVYAKNLHKINRNNQKINRKFNLGINKFADLTPFEFTETFTNLFKSDEKITSYIEKLIDQQRFDNFSVSNQINETDFIRNNEEDFRAVRGHVISQVNNRKVNVIRENSQFSLIDDVFASQNPRALKRKTRNQQLENYFDSHLGLDQKKNMVPELNIYYPNSNSFYNQFEHQLSNIVLSTKSLNPLKLTGDSKLVTTGSNLSSTSGNFSSFTIDWTVHAGKIRRQGECGACYVFATSDVVASLYSIYKFGFFVTLSAQQVVDCSRNGLTYGCNGGFLEGSYAYMQIRGIQTDSNYPYISEDSGLANSCKKDGGSFKIASFRSIEEGNCRALVNQLNYGPVSIGIAGHRLQLYKSGIFDDCNNYVDHAAVLIAYKSGVGWKIKNSWGADWGMNGFAWIADGNNCGICNNGVSVRI